jgi:hypothetical protein
MEPLFRNKKIMILFSIICILSVVVTGLKTVSAVDEGVLLQPDSHLVRDFVITEDPIYELQVTANASVNIYLLNETNAGLYMANVSFSETPGYTWKLTTSVNQMLDPNEIAELFGLNFTEMKKDEIQLIGYLVVENNGTNPVNVILLYTPESPLLSALRSTATFARLGFTIYLTIFLFINARRYKREDELDKARMLTGFANTFLFGSVNYFIDLFGVWYSRELHVPFYPSMKFTGVLFSFVNFRVDQIVFLTLLLFSDLFMIYQIEKIIGRRKRPILTLLLGISIIMNIMMFIYPPIFDISFAVFAIVLAISLLQIGWIYGTVIRQSRGLIRLKAICVLIGIYVPILMGMLGGELHPVGDISYLIANTISVLAVFLLGFGLK